MFLCVDVHNRSMLPAKFMKQLCHPFDQVDNSASKMNTFRFNYLCDFYLLIQLTSSFTLSKYCYFHDIGKIHPAVLEF